MGSITNFPNGISSMGMPVLPSGLFGYNSVAWFVDPLNGADGNDGQSPSTAFQTLYRAQYAAGEGRNDVVYLIGSMTAASSTAGTARLSLENAVAASAFAPTGTATPTNGTLTWAKKGVHLIGVCGGSNSPRARLAPPTGTYTQATFNSGNFVVVSATGCLFANIEVYNGFSTGGTNQIAWTDTGGRNQYVSCAFLGMNDSASASDAGSRSLKVGSAGSGENRFIECIIGGDTTTRSAANASLELAGGTPRNTFLRCTFPFESSSASVLGILGTGAACVDRWNQFDQCSFYNDTKSTSTTMTALASFTSASPGGMLAFKNCDMIGITKFGDTNALANSYINMPAVSAAAGGLAVNPS